MVSITFGFWDIMLVVVVSLQATVLAYLYDPKWKALVLNLPFPFTVASLALGQPIDATNVLGLSLLLIFTHSVRVFHYKFRLNIILSIILAASSYCLLGYGITVVLPQSETIFWVSSIGTLVIAALLLKILPHRNEQGHRSPLPVWIKLPAVSIVVIFLEIAKTILRGFMTVFPMVGVVAAYEARYSLWTIGRQIPVLMLTTTPMMMIIRLTQSSIGLGSSLALAWAVFAIILPLVTRLTWSSIDQVQSSAPLRSGL